jgi:hypothetical protein
MTIADIEDAMLLALLISNQSIADLANNKSKQRALKRLEKDKLVNTKRGIATLTPAGKTVANQIKAATDHLATLKAIENENEFDEHEIEFGRAAVAMMKAGYTSARCGWLVTCAWLAFQDVAKVQARRNALRVVGAVQPDDGAVQS